MASSAGNDEGRVTFGAVRQEFGLPATFPDEVLAEAERAVLDARRSAGNGRHDATHLPLVTVDPPGARDLDQAVLVEKRAGGGFRVRYAIADLGAFVVPGGALDEEVRKRGQTYYLPDGNVPLHPTVLSEGAASLLPGVVRLAALWTIDCDADGEPVRAEVRKALVRSVAQFDYATVQASAVAGTVHPSLAALPELGRLRRERAVRRGAVELQLPEQQVEPDGERGWRLVLRLRTEVDAWNAEISLLTGMVAAQMMLAAGVGVLRTLPDPDSTAVQWLRRSARSLGIDWPTELQPAALLAGLDPARPESLALFTGATRLLRGAGYTVFDGSKPELSTHAGIAASYTHVTAPLRRLVDRFGTEICLALCADQDVSELIRLALPDLPRLMEASDALASRVDRACLDQVEVWVLSDRVGEEFDAVVLRAETGSAEVILTDPPVVSKCDGNGLAEGERIRVRLAEVDPRTRKVRFECLGKDSS